MEKIMLNLSAIQYVTSGLTLLAFAVAASVIAYRAHLRSKASHLQSLPEGERLRASESILNIYHIDASQMTKRQVYEIALKEIELRSRRLYVTSFVLILISSLFFLTTIFVSSGRGGDDKKPGGNEFATVDCQQLKGLKQAQDDAAAKLEIGEYYRDGRCTKVDSAEAQKYFLAAANEGKPWGFIEIGDMYMRGQAGLSPDYLTARVYFQRAAEAGEPRGLTLQGTLYQKGWGVSKDTNAAKKLYMEAEGKGDARALTALGDLEFESGNVSAAKQYFEKADAKGDDRAPALLASIYEDAGDILKARDFYKKGIDRGDAKARYLLDSLAKRSNLTQP